MKNMKTIQLLIIFILFTFNTYSITISVNNVNIHIIFNELPIEKHEYSFNKLNYTLDEYNEIITKLKQELNKYPKNVIKKYIPKKIYVVNDILFKHIKKINGLSRYDAIILSKDVLIGSYSAYSIRFLHHEIFHQMTMNNKNSKLLYDAIKHNSIFKYVGSDIEENDIYTYNSEFVTTYHPNPSETAAEIFSYLMYVSKLDPHTSLVILWYNSSSANNNIKLKNNIAAVINFTAAISNNIMDNNFYLNLTKHL